MADTHMEWFGDEVEARTYDAGADGLSDALEHLLGVSQQLVPIEEEILIGTGRPDLDRDMLFGSVSYDTPYAVKQHEDMTLHHDPGRQAKYLEQPAHTEIPTMNALIAARLREAFS